MFKPLTSYWHDFIHKPQNMVDSVDPETSALFPHTKTLTSAPHTPTKLSKQKSLSQLPQFETARPVFLRKKSTKAAIERLTARCNDSSGRKKRGVKFGADYSSGSEDESDTDQKVSRPWMAKRASTVESAVSGATLVDEDEDLALPRLHISKEKAKITRQMAKADDPVPEYSDFEDNIAEDKLEDRSSPGWKPDFLRKRSPEPGHVPITKGFTQLPKSHEIASSQAQSSSSPSIPLRSVPATQSLIKAIDRVVQAQEAAYGHSTLDHAPSSTNVSSEFSGIMMASPKATHPVRPGLPTHKTSDAPLEAGMPRPTADAGVNPTIQRDHRWQNFWREVKEKATER
jgi:hypothetical protein